MTKSAVVPFPNPLQYEILKMRHRTGDKPTKAYCDVRIGPVTVFGVAVVWSDKKKSHFVSVPGRMGEKKFFPAVEIEAEVKSEVFAAVMDEFNRTRT